MDTPTPTHQPTHISLCSGYGGIDLGLRRCIPSLRTIAYSEIEASAIELLLARMEGGQLDAAPIWTDLKSFPWSAFSGRVDILSGGYPCQPFSSAGKRAGKDDPRHLWPWIADGIRILQPRVCFFENVEGHISLGLSSVISDLEELGYAVSWGLFSAAECGAPHQRKRVFIMAYCLNSGLERYAWDGAGVHRQGWLTPQQDGSTGASGVCAWPSRPGQPQHAWEPPRIVGNAAGNGRQHDQQSEDRWQAGAIAESGESVGNAACGRQSFGINARSSAETDRGGQGDAFSAESRQTEPALGGGADGSASRLDYGQLCRSSDNRTDELRMLGNGVVPATAERAFQTLIQELAVRETGTAN